MKGTQSTSVTAPCGFQAASGCCGIKPSGHTDLALIASEVPCSAAGLFTKNKFKGAPLLVTRRHLRGGRARAIVCNSGIANVATGERGERDSLAMCAAVGQALGIQDREVLCASTGMIGRALPMEKLLPGIARIAPELARGKAADAAAARAIMTTDTVPKSAVRRLELGKRRVTLGAIAKGSGMISPNMATMLAFITTDAAIDPAPLRAALVEAVNHTFNRTTIDSDTSTSDSVLVLANGLAGHRKITGPGRDFERFGAALTDLCRDLCEQLVRDGEGVTRVIRVHVTGAANTRDADRVGRAIADSPLVKTAIHGCDPNWGRIVMAVGKSGARVRPDQLSVSIAGHSVFTHGQPTRMGLNPTKGLERNMSRADVAIDVDLGLGAGTASWLGADLSREYVHINADYTT